MISESVIFKHSRYHTDNEDHFVFNIYPNSLKNVQGVPYLPHANVVINRTTAQTFVSEDTMQLLFMTEKTSDPGFLNAHLGPAGIQRRAMPDGNNTPDSNAKINITTGTAFHVHLSTNRTLHFNIMPGRIRIDSERPVMGGDYIVMFFVRRSRTKLVKFIFSNRDLTIPSHEGTIYPVIALCHAPLRNMIVLGRILTVLSMPDCLYNILLRMGAPCTTTERCIVDL